MIGLFLLEDPLVSLLNKMQLSLSTVPPRRIPHEGKVQGAWLALAEMPVRSSSSRDALLASL